MQKHTIKAVSLAMLLAFFLAFWVSPQTVRADDTSATYTLNIVKYKLSDQQLQNSTLPKTPTGSALTTGEAKDSAGNILEHMAGVSYQIDEVLPSNDKNAPFQIAPGNKSQTITTDSNGNASIALPAGIYRVTELSGNGISTPAAPVIVQLPMTLQNGQTVNNVYIYPKSSVVTVSPSNPENPTNPSTPTKIPNTAGNISSLSPVYFILAGVGLVGVYGLFIKSKKL